MQFYTTFDRRLVATDLFVTTPLLSKMCFFDFIDLEKNKRYNSFFLVFDFKRLSLKVFVASCF